MFKTFRESEMSVIDLSDATRRCSPRSVGPFADLEDDLTVHGTVVGGEILACGYERSDCFTYDVTADEWMPDDRWREEDRYLPSGLDVGGRHWVFGGGVEGDYRNSTEVFDGDGFQSSFDLPVGTAYQCMVSLGDGRRVFLATGYNIGSRAFIVDTSDGGAVEVAPLPLVQADSVVASACGLATTEDGTRLVVYAGGTDGFRHTLVFDLDLGVWTPGPELPLQRSFAAAVQHGDTFLLVGGDTDDSFGGPYHEDILRFDPDQRQWVVLPQKLENPDLVDFAIIVSESFVPCNEL